MATSHWLNRIGLAPLFAAMSGLGAATLVAAMLPGTFAAFVAALGLGTSRPLAMLVAFAAVALPVWLATTVVERALDQRAVPTVVDDDSLDLAPFAQEEAPVTPPVAQPRGPIFADRELGAPLMSEEALRTVAPEPVFEPEPEPVEAEIVAPKSESEADDTPFEAPAALFEPLEVEEFDLPPADAADAPRAGESSIDALIRRLEEGLSRRDPPAADSAPPQIVEVLRSEINRAAPNAAGRTGKPDDATARALQTLRQMATN